MKTPFKNEIEFKKALVIALKKVGVMVTPIQTRTISGVPDLFLAFNGGWSWVEVKCVHTLFNADKESHKIPFRPAQQPWAHDLFRVSKKPSYCVTAFKNGVYYFPMVEIHPENNVPTWCFEAWTLQGFMKEVSNA